MGISKVIQVQSIVTETTSQFMMLGVSHSGSVHGYNTNGLLQTKAGNLLIDCGYTIKAALHSQQLSFDDISAVFITHVHGDHVFGLERLAFESRFLLNKRISLYLEPKLYRELWDQTLRGSLGIVNGEPQSLEDFFDVILIEDNAFEFGGHQINTVEVDHARGKPAYGFVIDNYLFYSGDTRPIPHILENLEFEVGFHDATIIESSPVHANTQTLVNSYSPELCKKLYLMSYEDEVEDRAFAYSESFKGLAKVGERFELTALVTP
jgi:ribonuclease BN (tRNA processing enzyme)